MCFSVAGSRGTPQLCLLPWQGESSTLLSLFAFWFPHKATLPSGQTADITLGGRVCGGGGGCVVCGRECAM